MKVHKLSEGHEEAIRSAAQAGRRSALKGEVYQTNPYTAAEPELRLAWSEAHNGTRAALIQDTKG